MSATPRIYLITGANRGIGKGFVEQLLQRPAATVIATARDPAKAASLNDLKKGEGSRLIIVKLDSQVDTDAREAVAQLKDEHGITSIDAVIANAAISHSSSPVTKNTPEALRDHFNVNTISPVLLLQAVYPLLKSSNTGNPKFIPISSIIGSIGSLEQTVKWPAKLSPYGSSKAALNWLVSLIHHEEPWLTTWAVHPGFVMTDMSTSALATSGVDPASLGAITIETSVSSMLKLLDESTRGQHGGKFLNYDGAELPW